ncbi:transporter substrate-binding domain-containing protein [Methanogenium organophilum]|uniref:Transporter substrate-binding domain-containing protein n=1 Tax=Methanogenium organophilum TaxID=2199 RepID=A0A9X9S2Y9_METOG|nr:transporter substrate-binding domain-containing protein [Methanogenium organophilum]WAI00540.1 transporter substrate-binding domain-containing protein [Methanogenium organophilum]
MLSPRNHASLYLILLLGAILFVCGCVNEQPGESVPATTVPVTGTIESLSFYTTEMPPYNYEENGSLKGISVELLELATEEMGTNVSREELQLLSWSEGYQAVLDQKNSMIFTIARLPSRETSFKWAGPIMTAHTVIFARQGSGIEIDDPGDLQNYRIGVETDDAAIPQLLDIGVDESQIVQVLNATLLVSMLRDGDIDLWAYGEVSGRYFAEQVTGDASGIEVVYSFPYVPLYYAFSLDVPDATVQSFQQALDAVKTAREPGYSEFERILYRYLGVGCYRNVTSDAEVMALANLTAEAIEQDAQGTFRKINEGEAPYLDPENPARYVFVYDTDLVLVANADNPASVGNNFQGLVDVTGTPFRDEIRSGALQNGTGWVEYVFLDPEESGLYNKMTFYRLTQGSDGQQYIVCSGKYKDCGS